MPKESAKKIKSVPKRFLLLVLVLVAAVMAAIFYFKNTNTPRSCDGLYLKSQCIELEVSNTPQARSQGLSDREYLPEKTGMLFIFPEQAEQCFWMKDMRFSIDIIFLNKDKQVVKVVEKAAPESYPQNFCADTVQYVIELNSGKAVELNIKPGQTLNF